jgi:NAD(P)-dependent dehydrogenase (short-subunit alcohol dehydrogenase family)
MSKTVLITGCSSGFGKATAKLFSEKGWNVIATMRNPDKETELNLLPNVLLQALDVTKEETISKAIQNGIEKFGGIDTLINNAGYGLIGPIEGASIEQIQKQIATNLTGAILCVKAILPHFRANKSGHIINITSMGARITFPFYSLYHATKWGLDGFSEGLSYELKQFGIKIKIVEPGSVYTDFYDRSPEVSLNKDTTAYEDVFQKIQANYLKRAKQKISTPEQIAKTIWRATNDQSERLRYPAGKDAKTLLLLRKLLPERLFIRIMGVFFGV